MVSSTGQVSESRVASAAGECTAETGVEVNSPAEMTASTGAELVFDLKTQSNLLACGADTARNHLE